MKRNHFSKVTKFIILALLAGVFLYFENAAPLVKNNLPEEITYAPEKLIDEAIHDWNGSKSTIDSGRRAFLVLTL